MAPDVQMHLCFPKRSSIQENKQKVFRTNEHSKQQLIEQDIRSNHSSSKDEIYFDCQRTDKKPAILPPPHSIKLNPKRSLTKTNIFGMGKKFELHFTPVSHEHLNLLLSLLLFSHQHNKMDMQINTLKTHQIANSSMTPMEMPTH